MHRADGRIGKGLGVKARRVLGVTIVPKANPKAKAKPLEIR
jgi:hypothetical protein